MVELKTLAEAKVGEEFGTVEYVVTPEMVERFEKGVDNPAVWLDPPSNRGARLNPTVCDRDGSRVYQTKYVPPLGILHAKQEYEYLNPPRVGKKVRVKGKVVDRYVKKEREYTVVESVSVDEDGVEIIRGRQFLCYPLATKLEKAW